MKIAVMGAGVVGCYYGFKPARAGHDVVLVRALIASRRSSVRGSGSQLTRSRPLPAPKEAVQGARLVLFCVKRVRGIRDRLSFAYYLGSSVLGSLGGWFWREGGWAAVVAFCSALMMIVLGIAAKLRRGSDLSET